MDAETNSAAVRLNMAESLIRSYGDSPEAARARLLVDGLRAKVVEENLGKQWTYTERDDGMSSKKIRIASVTSTNSFEFDFPYTGRQHATLMLRRHPRWGNDVILQIERGQLLCSSYDCEIRVRFDEDAPRTYSGNEPADNSSESIFIEGYSRFEARLQKAKKLRVEVNVYDQGSLQLEFDVEGFKPDRLK
jgi:hypothetical protein